MSMPIPRPGHHLPGPNHPGNPTMSFADPHEVHAEVEALLGRLGTSTLEDGTRLETIPEQAKILEQAHDVLVAALATVDKI